MGTLRMFVWTLVTGVGVLGASAGAAAAQGTITGHITDNRGQPLSSVTVTVQGTQLGAVSNPDGTYRIARVPAGTQTVTARHIGYTPVTHQVVVGAGATATADFSLATSALNLQAVVVTGTAGNQTRVAQPAVIASVDAADVMSKAPISNVTDLLSARVPGVSVSGAAGSSGTASRMNIRGAASVNLSNQPLIFIDGVRISNAQRSPFLYRGSTPLQQIDPLNEISPDEIESIEIVKGPAAATLYGADASAGVIQIITKKGRLGAKHYTQNLSVEYNQVQPNFTPNTNYATCTGANLTQSACIGKPAGTVVSGNPLEYYDAYTNGHRDRLNYNGQGGGENYSYFVSGSSSDEKGTTINNFVKQRDGRGNLTWVATPKLSFDANMGISWNDYKIPPGDQDTQFGYLASSASSSPAASTVDANGNLIPAWVTSIGAISNFLNEDNTTHATPTAVVHYNPLSWFTNRLTLGADLVNTKEETFYPRNNNGWYNAISQGANLGSVRSANESLNTYTVDYLGDARTSFFGHDNITSDFSVGSQYINTVDNTFGGSGTGIVTNANNLVSSTTQPVGSQGFTQTKQYGAFAQEQLAISEQLYLTGAVRVDKFSSFGASSPSFVLPKVGVSYVLSKAGFWDRFSGVFPTVRLRAAYGTTGRAPLPGVALQTFSRLSYITDAGQVLPGVTPGSPGNTNLKAERGQEFEGGFDADLFGSRAGIELTYYHKLTRDLLLQDPLAPSLGFATSPFTNLGKVLNSGFEFSLHGTLIDRPNFNWDANFSGATLHNELLSLGGSPAINNSFRELVVGKQVFAYFAQKIHSIDLANNKALVSDTAEYLGNQFPTFTGNLSSTVTLFKNLRLYALFDTKRNYKVYNLGAEFNDRNFATSPYVNLPAGQGGYSAADRLKYIGPYYSVNTGLPVAQNGVKDPYIQDATFVRFRELSATLTLPQTFAHSLRAGSASLTFGGRNLHLWKSKEYTGYDPEILGTGPGFVGGGNGSFTQFFSAEVWTVPPTRDWLARLNLTF